MAVTSELTAKTNLSITLGSVCVVIWTLLAGAIGFIHGITAEHEKRIIILEQKRTADDERTKETETRRDRERTEILGSLRRIEEYLERKFP